MAGNPQMTSRIDLHLHTSRYSPDSDIAPWQMLADARAAGLTAVAITEHDTLWPADELAELNALPEARGLTVLGGVEVSAREGHFLCFGLKSLADVEPGIWLKDLLKEVAGQGGAIVAAHPFRWDQPFDEIIATHGPVFHGLERASKNVEPVGRKRVETLLAQHPHLLGTGSSDAHQPGQIGCYFTEFDAQIETLADLIAALKSGRGRARHHSNNAAWQPTGIIAETP